MAMLFNGVPLPDKIGLQGWALSTPKLTQRTIDVPDRRGLIYAGSKLGNRAITFSMALLADDWAEAVRLHEQLCEWALSDGPAPLVLPTREAQYIMAQCDTFPAPDMGQWWETFDVNFICPSPEFIDAFPHKCALESNITDSHYWIMRMVTGGVLSTPLEIDVALTETVSGLQLYFDDHYIDLSGEIAAGMLKINTENGAVTLDGSDVTYLATLSSDLTFNAVPGVHTVGWETGVGLSGSIQWHERWL